MNQVTYETKQDCSTKYAIIPLFIIVYILNATFLTHADITREQQKQTECRMIDEIFSMELIHGFD